MTTDGKRSHNHAALVLLFLSAVLFWPATRPFFVGDDFGWIFVGRFLMSTPDQWWQAFTQLNGAQMYRPLGQQAAFFVLWHLFGMDPPGYHLLNLALFLGTVLLVCRLCALHVEEGWPAAAAASVFAFSTTHYEHIAWASAICETMAGMAVAGSLLAHVRERSGWAATIYGLGLLCDETATVVPGFTLTYDLLVRHKSMRQAVVGQWPVLAVAALYVILRFGVLGVHAEGTFTPVWSAGVWAGLAWMSFRAALQVTGPLRNVWASGRVWHSGLALACAAVGVSGIGLMWQMVRRTRESWRVPVTGAAWFLLGLVPILPFAHNYALYNLDIPLIGLSLGLAGLIKSTAGQRWLGASLGIGLLAAGLLSLNGPGGWASVDGVAVLARASQFAYATMVDESQRVSGPLIVCVEGGAQPQWVIGVSWMPRLLRGGAPGKITFPDDQCPPVGLVLRWNARTQDFVVVHR